MRAAEKSAGSCLTLLPRQTRTRPGRPQTFALRARHVYLTLLRLSVGSEVFGSVFCLLSLVTFRAGHRLDAARPCLDC
jgi:hypothetical protein